MKPIKLRVPRGEAADLADDLKAWAAASGVDPRLTLGGEHWVTTNDKSPVLYQAFLNESFFEQFPKWRIYIEQ
jgi:hypothetical protein